MTTEELIAALRALAADLGRHPGAATATDAADRLEALTAPVEGMETTEKERAWVAKAEQGISLHPFDVPGTVIRVLHDFDRLSSALADLQERVGKARALMLTSPRWALALERAFALLSPEGEAKGEPVSGGVVVENCRFEPPRDADPVPARDWCDGLANDLEAAGHSIGVGRNADPVPAPLVTLDECPPGLFEFNGRLGFKSEYRTVTPSTGAAGMPDAYVVESGEYFWGGTTHPQERAKLQVRPVAARSAGITQGADR